MMSEQISPRKLSNVLHVRNTADGKFGQFSGHKHEAVILAEKNRENESQWS